MLNGIHQATRHAGVPLTIIQGPFQNYRIPALGAEQIAGWIVIHPPDESRANLAALCAAGAPVVTVPVPLAGVDCTLVQVDNRGGMCAAVLHLIEHGHRRIAFVDHGPYSWSQERYQGYCDALEQHGIAHDPALVIRMAATEQDGADLHRERGEHAARYLLERGLPCSALVNATDICALAALQVLQAAGHRVPEDMAVVGFDDMADAQYASPPLTTVRTQFDVIGRAAAEQLLAEIGTGQPAQPQIISVASTVLRRRSCGCNTLQDVLIDQAPDDATPTWQTTLTRQLVQVVLYPVPLDPGTPPAQLWPTVDVLVKALAGALEGQPAPSSVDIEAAWQQAVTLTENLEVLDMALSLLEDAAEQQLSASAATAQQRGATTRLLRQMRLELMRARLSYETSQKQHLNQLIQTSADVSMALINSETGSAQSLDWLRATPATWGCLAQWVDAGDQAPSALTIAGVYRRDKQPSIPIGQRYAATAFPPLAALPPSAQRGQDVTILFSIRSESRDWGMLAVCGWADQPLIAGTDTLALQAALLGATLARDTVLTTLTEQQETLRAAYEREHTLSQTVRELGSPIIPLLPHVLLVPLIGAIDSMRAQQITTAVLEQVSEQQAETVLLDITGVPIVDTQVANSLMHTTQAAMLLGARVIMVGIRPEIAQSLVGLGIDLHNLVSYSSLATAIHTLRLQGARFDLK
jgi:DNA-binding LacI/PurR family transcriptional regulator/anti-anti-sigma regulatory factor